VTQSFVGIDLGTTNARIAFLDGKEARIIPNRRGNRFTPSVVAFSRDGEVLVGESARNQSAMNPQGTVSGVKRLMGSRTPLVIHGVPHAPEEISAHILKSLKADAEEYLGSEVNRAVITVPAYFTEPQRRATMEAGRLAGLEVMRIVNEPTAVALANGHANRRHARVLVYDLGGGTFDVTVLDTAPGFLEVLAAKGDNALGGLDFDARLFDLLMKEFQERENPAALADPLLRQKIREETEAAKIELSARETAAVGVPFVGAAADASTGAVRHLNRSVTRAEFEGLIGDLVDRTLDLTREAVADAGLGFEAIDVVLLSGGSTRIPLVRERLGHLTKKTFERGANPTETVALGAAIQAGISAGEIHDMALVDVTPFSLGVEIDGGLYMPLIERNTPIPAEASRLFTTVADDQGAVEIHILQGVNGKASGNTSLGRFLLSGIRAARRGEPRIMVRFVLDADGIIHVSARDRDTKARQSVSLASSFTAGTPTSAPACPGLAHRKNHVRSLRGRLARETAARAAALDDALRAEIDETVRKADRCLLSGDPSDLDECALAMETLLGELSAAADEWRVGYGGA